MVRILNVILLISLFGLSACEQNCELENYNLNEAFAMEIDVVDYCTKIEQSLDGDSVAFNSLLAPPTETALMIDHANIISQLILDLGKQRICGWLDDGVVSYKQLNSVLAFSTYKYVIYRDESFFDKGGNFRCD